MYSIKVNDNQRRKQMPYQVVYAVDTLDTNPNIDLFDTFREAEDFASDEVRRRVDHIVEHSPFPVSAKDRALTEEQEYVLVKIEEVE
tara:strand:- start:923 stop:1183 length:261 start_codon:yes stop_codon:yes gene_type:complete